MKNEEMEKYGAYLEEVLEACQNGKPCSYGICDECPLNFLRVENDEVDQS